MYNLKHDCTTPFLISKSKSGNPSVIMANRSSSGDKKIQRFVSDQLKLLETERLAVTMQERLESKELGEEVDVEVVDVKKTSYGGLILKLKQRGHCKSAPNFKVGENVGLDDPQEDSEPFPGIIKESVKK